MQVNLKIDEETTVSIDYYDAQKYGLDFSTDPEEWKTRYFRYLSAKVIDKETVKRIVQKVFKLLWNLRRAEMQNGYPVSRDDHKNTIIVSHQVAEYLVDMLQVCEPTELLEWGRDDLGDVLEEIYCHVRSRNGYISKKLPPTKYNPWNIARHIMGDVLLEYPSLLLEVNKDIYELNQLDSLTTKYED